MLTSGFAEVVRPKEDPFKDLSAEQRALMTVIGKTRQAVVEAARAINRWKGVQDDPGVMTAVKHIEDGLFMLHAVVRKGRG